MNSLREESIKTTYPGIQKIDGFNELVGILEPSDEVIFDNITELDPTGTENRSVIIENYHKFIDRQVTMFFDRSPNCNPSVIKDNLKALFGSEERIDEAQKKTVLGIEIDTYTSIRDAEVNMRRGIQFSANKIEGKQLGRPKGPAGETKKATLAKKQMLELSKFFNGTLPDKECIKIIGISKNTYYIYKKQLMKSVDASHEPE